MSLVHFPDRLGEDEGGGLLDQVALRTQRDHLIDVLVVAVGGEDHDLGRGKRSENLAGGLQAVEQRHRDVHDDHRRHELLHDLERLAAVLRDADHLDVALRLEQRPKPFQDHGVVLDQNDGDRLHAVRPLRNGICARTVVPFPGADSMANVPPTISIRSRMPSSPNRRILWAWSTRWTSKDFPSSWISKWKTAR